jgi:hypothetical protein
MVRTRRILPIPENGLKEMDSEAWSKRIEGAASEADVVGLVRQYLESRDPGDIARLPGDCRPPRYYTREDITDCAYRMAAYHGHDEAARLIHRLGSVMTAAAVRFAELAGGESKK